MGPAARRILEALAAGPATSATLDAGMPDTRPRTLTQARYRLRADGLITRDAAGAWAVTDAGLDALGAEMAAPAPADLTRWQPAAPSRILQVPADSAARPSPETAGIQDDQGQGQGQAPAAPHWRDGLGDLTGDPEDQCSPRSPCGGNGPIRWVSAHTGTVCTTCGPASWAPSSAAVRRADKHQEATRARAVRSGTATARVPQEEIDAADREANRARRELIRQVEDQLRGPLHPDSVADLEWFRDQAREARDTARIGQLAGQLAGLEIRGPGIVARVAGLWQRRRVLADYRDYEWTDEDQDYEDQDYEAGDDSEDHEDQAPAARPARLTVVPGFVAPDPNWRRDPDAVTYWDGLARHTWRLPPQQQRPAANPLRAWDEAATRRARRMGAPRTVPYQEEGPPAS